MDDSRIAEVLAGLVWCAVLFGFPAYLHYHAKPVPRSTTQAKLDARRAQHLW